MLMRAKMQVSSVVESTASEQLRLAAVCGNKPFGQEGESEDNTYAHWTPTAVLEMTITNPSLFGKFKVGQKFYVDFTESLE
jgi:hypothetical protein